MVTFMEYEMVNDERQEKRVGIFHRMFGGRSTSSTTSDEQSTFWPGSASPPRERRPLRSVPTSGPQFRVDPEILVKKYVEKELKYMGTIGDISHDFNSGNRWVILSLLDEKRKLDLLPTQLSWQHDVIISFSLPNIKVLRRDGEEELIRISTHQVASTGYMQDDSQIILFVKFASELNHGMASIAFFSCESKALAHEICCLTQQLLQLAYSDSTTNFINKPSQSRDVAPLNYSPNADNSIETRKTTQLSLPINQHKQVHTGGRVSSPVSTASSPVPSFRSRSKRGSTNNPRLHPLQEYIEVLKECLTHDELTLFAQHLHHFRTGKVPIETFCEQLMEIYTEQRKFLMLGMRHFIPLPQDQSYFENFLAQLNLDPCYDVKWSSHPSVTSEMKEGNSSADVPVNAKHFTCLR